MLDRYRNFLQEFDNRLSEYQQSHNDFICCVNGCSACCKQGDYPLSRLELDYLMQGYISLDTESKKDVQANLRTIKPGGQCPFLIQNKCSIYAYRPIVCRVHGLAYLCKEQKVKLPHCANIGKNYSNVYKDNLINIEPIMENLDTPAVLKDFDYGEIRNLCDWIKC